MSVKSTLLEDNDSILQLNHQHYYPDIVYTLEPTIQQLTRLLRILRWKKGYIHQSIILTLLWTLFWFHTLIISYTIPIWITIIIYHSYMIDDQHYTKETTVNSFEKLTVELKEIQLELSLILPSPEQKDKFRHRLRQTTQQFILKQSFLFQSFLFFSLYAVYVALLKGFGADKIVWFMGCVILTWHSPLLKVTRYSYHRASFMLKQSINKRVSSEATAAAAAAMNGMNTVNKQTDHFDRYYHFVVIEHQRWWLHCGWSSLLLPNERPEWSDEYLSQVPSIHSFHLPPPTTRVDKHTHKTTKISWEWISQEWEIDQNHNVDKNGWEYGSFDWKSWSTKSSGLRVLTRRRHWVRNARLVVEALPEENDHQSFMTATTTMSIPILLKKTNTTTSLSTSLSSEDSYYCSTPTSPTTTLFHSKSSSTTSTHTVEPSIFSDYSTVDSHLWLRR